MKRKYFPGWDQVGVSLLNQGFSSGSIIVAFSVVGVELIKEFHASAAALGLTMTITYLVNNLMNPVIGAGMDRYSLRRILLAGSVFLAVGYIALSFVTSFTQVYLVYGALLGMANSIMGPLSYTTLLPRWFVRLRARATGITALGYSIGGLLLPVIFHELIASFGWRQAMQIFAGVVIVFLIPVIAWLVIDRPSDVGLYPDGDKEPPQAAQTPAATAVAAEELPTRMVLTDMNFWVLTLVIGLVVSGAAGILSNMAPLAISKGFTSGQGAFAVVAFSAGSFTNKVLYSIFGDRLKPKVGLSAGLLFFTVSSFCFVHANTYPILLVAGFLQGLAIGTVLPLWSYLTALVFGPPHVGRVFGLITMLTTPMSLSMPPFLGWVYDKTGAYDSGFYLYIGLALVFAVMISRFRPEGTAERLAAAT